MNSGLRTEHRGRVSTLYASWRCGPRNWRLWPTYDAATETIAKWALPW